MTVRFKGLGTEVVEDRRGSRAFRLGLPDGLAFLADQIDGKLRSPLAEQVGDAV